MKPSKEQQAIKFEQALENLENIVQELEGGELALERLIERYEEGMQLVKVCRDKLSEAEQKVEILTKSAVTSSDETTSESLNPKKQGGLKGQKKENDEVSLF